MIKRLTVLAILAFGVASVLVWHERIGSTAHVSPREKAHIVRISDTAERPCIQYRLAVVPCGVHSEADLKAAQKDPVVARAYSGLRIVNRDSKASTWWDLVVDQRRPALPMGAACGSKEGYYLQYRRGDQILWTRARHTLHPQETVVLGLVSFTVNGKAVDGFAPVIRARCGNRLSLTPQQPTEAHPPSEADLGEVMPPLPYSFDLLQQPSIAAILPGDLPLSLTGATFESVPQNMPASTAKNVPQSLTGAEAEGFPLSAINYSIAPFNTGFRAFPAFAAPEPNIAGLVISGFVVLVLLYAARRRRKA